MAKKQTPNNKGNKRNKGGYSDVWKTRTRSNKPPKQETWQDVQDQKSEEDSKPKGSKGASGARTPVNDPSQFIPTEENSLLESLTWFTFPQIMGRSIKIPQVPLYQGAEGDMSIVMPTASQIRLSPSIGGSTKSQLDPINVAATNLYVRLSARNNKTTTYAPQDVMTLVLAMGQIIAIEEYIRRALKITFNVNSNNLSVPRSYFTAMGIDFDDYKANVANYRDRFNVIVSSINAITFMADIPYIGYCKDIYSRVFKDSVTNLYGLHFVVPGHTWVLEENADVRGSVLRDVEVVERNSVKVLDYYMDLLEQMITEFKLSSTFNVIYSDILALFDRDHFNTITIPLFSVAEQLEFEYNIMFNIMLRHGTIIGENYGESEDPADPQSDRTKNSVYPDPNLNILYQDYVFKCTDDFLMWNRLVNFFETNSPDANTRFEMTRWMAIGGIIDTEEFDDALAIREPVIQNTFINSVDIYQGDTRIVSRHTNIVNNGGTGVMAIVTNYLKMANLPMLFMADVNASYEITTARVMSDIDAWSSVDYQYLVNLRNQTMIYFFGA